MAVELLQGVFNGVRSTICYPEAFCIIIIKTMIPKNILQMNCRADFRRWLSENHDKEAECWLAVKRGKNPPSDSLWYLDAVEEALCFGWIDSTVKSVDGWLSSVSAGARKKAHGQN